MRSHDGDMVLLMAIDDDHVVRVSGDRGGLKCDFIFYESVDLGFAAIPWLTNYLGCFLAMYIEDYLESSFAYGFLLLEIKSCILFSSSVSQWP